MKRAATAALVTAAVIALGLGACTAVGGRPNVAPSSAGVATTTTASAKPQVKPARPFVPKPEDFTMTVRRVGTRCGFSIRPPAELADQRVIHCKAAYRTAVGYHGKPLDHRGSYIVFYQVVGSVLGSESYSFTIKSGRLPVLPVRSALVHSGAVLSAIPNNLEWMP